LSILKLPGSWTDYKLKHELIPNEGLTKRGYLHLFKAENTQFRDMLLDDRLYEEDTFETSNSRFSIKFESDAAGPYDVTLAN
jgi:hypothetical protein